MTKRPEPPKPGYTVAPRRLPPARPTPDMTPSEPAPRDWSDWLWPPLLIAGVAVTVVMLVLR